MHKRQDDGALLHKGAPRFTITAVALAVAASTPPVQAESLVLEEVIVTATKRDETLADVAETVNILSGDKLTEFNITSFQDIQHLTPGLTLQVSDARSQSISMRGVSYDPDSATPGTVTPYINGVPVQTYVAFQQLYDIQRIEVLRGPQGTLQGETSPSGSIHIYTERANLNRVEGKVRQIVDDNDGSFTELAGSYPLIKGVLAVRLAGVYHDSERYGLESASNGTEATRDTRSGRLNIQWVPLDDLVASATFQHMETHTDGLEIVEGSDAFSSSAATGASLGTGNPTLDAYDRTSLQTGASQAMTRVNFFDLNLDWVLGDHTLTFVGGYQDYTNFADRDLDRGNIFPGEHRNQLVDSDYNITTAELRFADNDGGSWEYLGGVYYNLTETFTINTNKTVSGFHAGTLSSAIIPDEQPPRVGDPNLIYSSTSPIGGALPLGPLSFLGARPDKLLIYTHSEIPLDIETFAVFTDNRFHLTDRTTLQVGLRWQTTDYYSSIRTVAEEEAVLVSDGSVPGLAPGNLYPLPASTVFPAGIPASQEDNSDDVVTGTLKLSHDIDFDTTVYASYGRSYRAGGFTISPTPGVDAEILQYDEETSDSLELGFKSRFQHGRYQLNGAVYYQRFSDFIGRAKNIALDLDGDGTLDTGILGGVNFNSDAIIRGAEMEFTGLLTENWLLFAAASYNDAKYDDANVPCGRVGGSADAGSQLATCQSDGRLGAEPNWSLNLSSEYTIPGVLSGADAYVRGLYRFTDNRADDFAAFNTHLYDEYNLGAYGVWDLYLGLRAADGRWDVNLFCKNLFDKQARTSLGYEETVSGANFGLGGMGDILSSGYSTAAVIPERTIGVTASYRVGGY